MSTVPGNPDVSRAHEPRTLRGWLLLFVAALLLYALTANRGAQWQDPGHHMLRIVTGEVVNPRGLALSHPLHHWLGRLAAATDVVQPSLAITLISAVAAAFAVANVFGCVLTLTRHYGPAVFAAVSLALASTFWQLATVTETYTLTAALLAAECWCLAAYFRKGASLGLVGALFFNGLGVSNHLLAILTLPILAVILVVESSKRRIRAGAMTGAAGAWILGSLPYTILILLAWVHSGSFLETMHSALFGQSWAGNVLNLLPSKRSLMVSVGFPILNFPNLLIPAAVYGIFRGARTDAPSGSRYAATAALVLHYFFAARYDIVDQQTFFLPTYVMLCILGGIGAEAVRTWRSASMRRIVRVAAIVLIVLTPAFHAALPTAARKVSLLRGVERNKPYRDDYVYIFSPWSVVETSAEQMASQAVALAGKDGLILIEDHMATYAVLFHAEMSPDRNPHVLDIGPRDAEQSETAELIREAADADRPVVLVPWDADQPYTEPPVGRWRRDGDLYVLDTGQE